MLVEKGQNISPTQVQEQDISGVEVKVLISDKNGAPNFVMRLFELEPGGHTAYHTHPWEHEVYVLEGTGGVKEGNKEHRVEKGSFILVTPGEEHQFINRGDNLFKFICVVPLMKGS
jgi:quercetin dioxygenase-like cupin family protein